MGGKRKKSASGPIKKASKYKIPGRFDCPICDAKSSIAVQIFRSTGEAAVYCRTCKVGLGRHWKILPLEKAVDVFFRFREELMNLDRQYLEECQTNSTIRHGGTDVAGGDRHGAPAVATTHARDLADLSRPTTCVSYHSKREDGSGEAGSETVAYSAHSQDAQRGSARGSRVDGNLDEDAYDDGADLASHVFAPRTHVHDEDDYAHMFD